ncbi:MAG: tRNA (adenine-N1)-methyltransferase, partial [Anaerolineae bacterium]
MPQPNALIQLIDPKGKDFIFRLKPGEQLHTHRGVIRHDDLLDKPLGAQVYTHMGHPFLMVEPSLNDLLLKTRRNTTIMYPKDIGFILLNMNIGAGQHVLEAGTGSGSLTTALAWAVGPQGRVTTYEVREPMQNLARKNLERVGLAENVTFKLGDIANGFEERNVDALFLDVRTPEAYIPQVRQALKPGGFFGSLIPTTNQVSALLRALQAHDFDFITVCEVLLRYYKPVPDRLRPKDRMVAHTGFLVFARPVIKMPPPAQPETAQEE